MDASKEDIATKIIKKEIRIRKKKKAIKGKFFSIKIIRYILV